MDNCKKIDNSCRSMEIFNSNANVGYATASKLAPFDLAKYSYYILFYAQALCGGDRAQLSRRTCGTCKCIGWVFGKSEDFVV